MKIKSVPTNALPEAEWELTDLRNLAEAIARDLVKKYDLLIKIAVLEGKMTPEEVAAEGDKLVRMGYALSMENHELAKKIQELMKKAEV